MTKKQEIRDHLLSGQPITGILSIKLFGLYRLSSVINRLRNEGLPITTVMVEDSNRKTLFAKYFITISDRAKLMKK